MIAIIEQRKIRRDSWNVEITEEMRDGARREVPEVVPCCRPKGPRRREGNPPDSSTSWSTPFGDVAVFGWPARARLRESQIRSQMRCANDVAMSQSSARKNTWIQLNACFTLRALFLPKQRVISLPLVYINVNMYWNTIIRVLGKVTFDQKMYWSSNGYR